MKYLEELGTGIPQSIEFQKKMQSVGQKTNTQILSQVGQ